jgi:hypothetical protein
MPWRMALARSTNSFSMLVVVLYVRWRWFELNRKRGAEGQLYAAALMATRPCLAGAR